MNPVLFAMCVVPLPVKLIGACLAGLVPGILSGRLRADGKLILIPFLLACVAVTLCLHSAVYLDPGLLVIIAGFIVGFAVFVLARSNNASILTAASVTLLGLVALGVVTFLRMPPAEMRHAIAQIQRDGGVVQQSDNPGTTYQDQWWVDFTRARLDDNALLRHASDLRKLPKLWLTLSSCPIGDHGLSGLAEVKNLVWLDLDGTQITDSGLPHLSELSRLERLDLSRTRVSNEGLHNLSQLANLETLLLYKTAVTQSSVQELRKSLPNCHIIFDDEHQ